MSGAPRPILKLKVGGSAAGGAGSPTGQTPTSTSTPKLKLKFGGAQTPQTEAPPVATPAGATTPKIKFTTKKQKPAKPLKLSTGKKREHGDVDDGAGGKTAGGAGKVKRIKLRTGSKGTPTTPFIKFKGASKGIQRPRGEAYDEIASDCENDPWISEGFVLRMVPGEDCEYIRTAIENKQWGPRSKGGADIKLKFYTIDGRRASLTIRGKIYACALVDLPCIIEGMKSWDKKAWYKSADICQMLLVLGPVKEESEVNNYPLPPDDVDAKTMQYAHGVTPPMRWVRKRRFRKRISLKTIEAVENEVDRLLSLDDKAVEQTRFELVDLDKLNRVNSGQQTPQSEGEFPEGELDAEGEQVEIDGYFDDAVAIEEEDEDALAAQFELAMQDQDGEGELEAETPADSSTAAAETQPVTDSEMATPAAGHTSKDEDSGDLESDEDEDDADDMDEDALEERAGLLRQKEEIEELRAVIKDETAYMERTTNAILKKKKAERVQNLTEELRIKQAAIGEDEDDG